MNRYKKVHILKVRKRYGSQSRLQKKKTGRTNPQTHTLNQLSRIPLPPRTRFTAQVHEIIRIVVAITHDIMFGIVQQGHEFIEESVAAFGGELVVESPHARAEGGED